MNYLETLLYKINSCIDYQSIYSLEKAFNLVSLTIQTTSKNRIILCKIKDNKPFANNIIDDYIFIGSLNDSTNELTERAIEKICDFVENTAGKPSKLKNIARAWRNGLRMYGASIAIHNEDIECLGSVINE